MVQPRAGAAIGPMHTTRELLDAIVIVIVAGAIAPAANG